jgi:hypothetical protein
LGESPGTTLSAAGKISATARSGEAVRDHPDLLARLVRVFCLTPAAFLRWCDVHGQLRPQDTAALGRRVHDLFEP